MTTRTERLTFPGSAGAPLAAVLESPPAPRAHALFAHCFTCSKDLKGARRIARALVARGYGVMRFDFTGLGESGGEFAETGFSSNVADLVAAARFMGERGAAPGLLVGHSLGGAAVLAAAGAIPEARAVATIGAPSDPAHLAAALVRRAPELARGEGARIRLGGREIVLGRQLLEDLERSRIDGAIARLSRALLVMHSPADEIVGIDHARRIYEAARHPKSFVSLDDADHLLTRERDAIYAAEVLAAWASRYLPEREVPPAGKAAERDAVTVAEAGPPYLQEITAGEHRLAADEPVALGGGDRGPTPYELLLAALGACTSMTLRMYAKRKGWPLAAVAVTLRHRRIHAEDCSDCETKEGRVDEIERVLRVDGPLSPDQRERLVEIAGRCPVHRTLTGEIKIRTSLETT